MSDAMEEKKKSGNIRRLDETVVNRIAAGEIIQRPANAIKELLENSLDAQSTSINVSVKSGGLKVLQIQDNGTGIQRDDMTIVCERFTTSKLKAFDDLKQIATYGFRGEALASISHVGHVTITTRTEDSPCAYKARYSDGKLVAAAPGKSVDPQPCAGNKGTQILVEDLFYNVPTRRKALKSHTDEYNRLQKVIVRYAIHNAGVAFSLRKIGATPDVRTVASSTKLENIRTLFGNQLAKELIGMESFSDDMLGFTASGFITNPNYSVKKGTFILFINHRLVHSTSLKKAIDQVYTAYLPKQTFPFIYISLEIAPEKVDVNVHPTKEEVHFLNEEKIIEKVQLAVEARLKGSNSSRTFYTQSLLTPTVSSHTGGTSSSSQRQQGGTNGKTATPLSSSGGPTRLTTYDHNLVRTDPRAQSLLAFFDKDSSSPAKTTTATATSISSAARTTAATTTPSTTSATSVPDYDSDEWDPIRQRPKKRTASADSSKKRRMSPVSASAGAAKRRDGDGQKSSDGNDDNDDDDDDKILPAAATETIDSDDDDLDAAASIQKGESTGPTTTWPPSGTKLTSVANIRADIATRQIPGLRDLFQAHKFVGCVNPKSSLVQYKTKLFIVKTENLCEELFYQLAIRGFGSFNAIKFDPPVSLEELLVMAMTKKESGWTESQGDPAQLAEKMAKFLQTKAEMLQEYFSIQITENGRISAIPAILDFYTPAMNQLPMFVFNLAAQVCWDTEQECFESIAQEIGHFYRQFETEGAQKDWKWLVEHVVLAASRTMLQPSQEFVEDMTVVQVADLHELYKVFERC